MQLLDIITKTPGVDALTIIKPYQTKELAMPTETQERSIYIWSEAQEKYSADYIDEYLRLNKISTAIVSVRKDGKNKTNATTLLDKLSVHGIHSELLIGSNKLLSDKNPNIYFDSAFVGVPAGAVVAIHLDVEPQATDDWQTNKDKYLLQYVELLKKTKEYCNRKGVKLSVSIPVFFPDETLKEIYALADKVYVMAYEHNDADFILKKVKEEFTLSSDKTIIALRAKDFKNRNEFESLIKELGTNLNTNKFAMHDLETFVKLDEISVGSEK